MSVNAAIAAPRVGANMSKSVAAQRTAALKLEQYGEVIGGRTTTVSKDGLKIVSRKGGLTIVSRAPEWNVVLFNSKSRLYWELPRAKFKGDPNARIYGNDQKALLKARWNKAGTGRILGRKVNVYEMVRPPKGAKEGATSGTLYLDAEAAIAKEAFEILGKVYFLPPVIGVPLKFKFKDFDDGHINALDTGTLDTLMVSREAFVQPSNFKKAKSLEEVMVDPTSQATFDALRHFVNK